MRVRLLSEQQKLRFLSDGSRAISRRGNETRLTATTKRENSERKSEGNQDRIVKK